MPTTRALPPTDNAAAPVIVHSHLRWDFVWQRPQQILSRLSQRHPVLFVEEPIFLDDADSSMPRLEISEPHSGIHRAVPLLPASLRAEYDASIGVVRDLIRAALASTGPLANRFVRPIQWFYTPMPAPAMIGAFDERAIVYDCMDELSKFRFAPTALVDRERRLLASADVVFTGGYRLAQAKARYHENVHFFGCGVDTAHFAQARSSDLEVAPELASIIASGQRVLGYYGVIDERLDYPLIAALAAQFPNDAVVMVGPVVKVDPAELPRAANLHWLGQRTYEELPAIVKGFDVCLMPFALNEATEFINPTKTLEYMAAGKPIVSTALHDVLHHFVPVVAVAKSTSEFLDLAGSALTAPDAALLARGLEESNQSSWDTVVARMERVLVGAIGGGKSRVARTQSAATRADHAGLIPASDVAGD